MNLQILLIVFGVLAFFMGSIVVALLVIGEERFENAIGRLRRWKECFTKGHILYDEDLEENIPVCSRCGSVTAPEEEKEPWEETKRLVRNR